MPYSGYPFAAKVGQFKPPNWTNSEYRNHRKVGEYTLPDGWAIIAAGNRDSDRAVTTRMPTPLRNRFVHLEFEVDVQEWSEWAIQAGIRPEVISFLRFRPELLSAFDRVM